MKEAVQSCLISSIPYYMTCRLLQNIFFREFARFFRETSHFRDIEIFCFREIMLPLKYAIQTIAFSKDWNLLFSGDWNMSFSGNYNTLILERLKCAIFGGLKYVIFGKLQYFNYWKTEMCYFRDIEMFNFFFNF